MQTHLSFRNAELVDEDAREAGYPEGEKLARLIASALPEFDFGVRRIVQEDWGWVIVIVNPRFFLWVGCGPDIDTRIESDCDDAHVCFIQPDKPKVRWLLWRIDTTEVISRLAGALETIVKNHAVTREIRWWSEDEVRQR